MAIISIIVPVYNLEGYIQHTLDSLFAQTYKEIEVIAVDDGSTDGSPQILDEYAAHEPRLRVIHQPNGGVSAARNAGLAVAMGDYIGFCDGDDEVEPTMYERLLENLLKYDADISHCGMLTKGLDGKVRYFHNTGVLKIHSREEGLLELLKGEKVEPSLCMKLYKKELFQGVQFDPSIKINEDLLANVELFQKTQKSVFEDICLYHYIRRQMSASKSTFDEWLASQLLVVRRKIIALCKNEIEIIQNQCKANYLLMCISIYSKLKSSDINDEMRIKSNVRLELKKQIFFISFLPFSSKVHALIIIYCPKICNSILKLFKLIRIKKSYG